VDAVGGAVPQRNQRITYGAYDYGKASVLRDSLLSGTAYELALTYTPDQQRGKAVFRTNNAVTRTTLYAPRYEKITEGGVTRQLTYLHGADGLAAIYVKQAGQSDKIYYAHQDHLGSITKLTDASGSTVVFAATYDAWGKQTITTNTFAFHRGYTGHEHLPEFGLINMNGRMYDPILGRMLSPDNYVQAPEFSQSYNRYSYCLNNPLKYTDPSGEFFIVDSWLVGFFKGLFQKGGGFKDAWNTANKMAGNDAKIWGGLFISDSNKPWYGQIWEVVSRFTWQSPQTLAGFVTSHAHNTFRLRGGVESVDYKYGATVLRTNSGDWGGVTLGSYIIGNNSIRADANNPLFQHEYGHYLQSQEAGLLYTIKYAFPSILSAASAKRLGNDHQYFFSEQDANARAFKYFTNNIEGFNDAGHNNTYPNGRWWSNSNPIIGYDWTKPYNDPDNQLALQNNIFSSSYMDYLTLGSDGILLGYLQLIFGYGHKK
jgi:RHS repeat-associated protein